MVSNSIDKRKIASVNKVVPAFLEARFTEESDRARVTDLLMRELMKYLYLRRVRPEIPIMHEWARSDGRSKI